jgi:hypothetical protein
MYVYAGTPSCTYTPIPVRTYMIVTMDMAHLRNDKLHNMPYSNGNELDPDRNDTSNNAFFSTPKQSYD